MVDLERRPRVLDQTVHFFVGEGGDAAVVVFAHDEVEDAGKARVALVEAGPNCLHNEP